MVLAGSQGAFKWVFYGDNWAYYMASRRLLEVNLLVILIVMVVATVSSDSSSTSIFKIQQ